jgi:hypothetical protein
MSITGVSASTLNGDRAASSDGVDDFGLTPASGPTSVVEKEKYGIAMVFRSSDTTDPTFWMGAQGTDFQISDSDGADKSNGEIRLFAVTGNGAIKFETKTNFCDGNIHIFVMNKRGDDPSAGDIEMFVDDMTTQTQTTNNTEGTFDTQDFSLSSKMTFFAGNTGSDFHKEVDQAFIEFNEQPYSQQDRLDLKQRAPGF